MEFKKEIEKLIIIGDIHGCHKTFKKLINQLPKNVLICCVGDLVDRGKNSSMVINEIISNDYLSVLGNHELMMNYYYNKPQEEALHWLHQGGYETLKSYSSEEELNIHIQYIQNLPIYIKFKFIDNKIKPLVVSHSAAFKYLENTFDEIKDEINYKMELLENVLWNRDMLIDKNNTFGNNCDYFNIFGHTILEKPKITNNYVAIDTGSFLNLNDYTKSGGISAIEYPSMQLYYQENIED